MSEPAPLALPTAGQIDGLRAALQRAGRLSLYRELFAGLAIDRTLIEADPLAGLTRLPVFDPTQMGRFADEALEQAGVSFALAAVELSSGTSGGPAKRRVLSERDVASDAALLARLLHVAGVRADDRAAAIEWTAQPLSAAFLEGCERLGVVEAAALSMVGPADTDSLCRYDPIVLIAPPRLLSHLLPDLLAGPPLALRLVIYNGDRLTASVAAALRARGVGVRSLYGLTETSALGVACAAEAGVHLDPAQALAETRPVAAGRRGERELVVTTLAAEWPLLRYPTGDRVRPLRGRCPCGLSWPRIDLLGRLGDRFALFDLEFSADELLTLIGADPATAQIVLDRGPAGSERLTIRQPAAARPDLADQRRLLRRHSQLDFLLHAGLVRLRFRDANDVSPTRKLRRLIDRRDR